jgi:CubicO group peptidase (beta-lactamase class C family)
VAGALAAATGKNVSDYLSEKFWSPLGMEADAHWWLESPEGLEIGGSGLSATLREYARFGLFLLNEGKINGRETLPEGWMETSSREQRIDGELVEYGYMALAAWGWRLSGHRHLWPIYRRLPRTEYGGRHLGAQSKPEGSATVDEYDFFNGLAQALP